MGTHLYVNPGPRSTITRTNFGGTIAIPTTTDLTFKDGVDTLRMSFTDLDTLDEMVRLFEQARAEHVAALCDGKSEVVHADQLGPEDLAVVDGELVLVDTVILDQGRVIIRYSRKYKGNWDVADRSITVARSLRVKRLLADVTLEVVR